jgi:hypothetical protein
MKVFDILNEDEFDPPVDQRTQQERYNDLSKKRQQYSVAIHKCTDQVTSMTLHDKIPYHYGPPDDDEVEITQTNTGPYSKISVPRDCPKIDTLLRISTKVKYYDKLISSIDRKMDDIGMIY